MVAWFWKNRNLGQSCRGDCVWIARRKTFVWISSKNSTFCTIKPSVAPVRLDIRNSRCTTGINDTGGKFANEHLLQRFHLSGKSYQRRSMLLFLRLRHRMSSLQCRRYTLGSKAYLVQLLLFRLLIYLTFFHVFWFVFHVFLFLGKS